MERRLEGSGLKKIYSKVSAENAEDLIFRNHALFELGQLYMEKCDFPNAVDCFEKVKTEALQFHLYDNYFKAISCLLRIHAERLDFSKYDSLIREMTQVGSSLTGYKRYEPKIHYKQGIAASYRRAFDEARVQFSQAKVLTEELMRDESIQGKEREEMTRDLLSARYALAMLEKDEKNPALALKMSEDLLKEIEECKHGANALEHVQVSDIEASLVILQGHCHRDLGDPLKALDRYWLAHSILKTHRNWSHYYYVLLGLGRAYQALGNQERAQIFFDLIADAIGNLELNALKKALERVSKSGLEARNRLLVDRERKVIIEPKIGEVHFERRFVLLEIFYLLASSPGKVFSKEDLVDKIWRESYNPMIHDSKVYTSISRLRKLIEPDFKRPVYILNERDGYAFNPAVQLEEVSPRLRKTGAHVSGATSESIATAEPGARPGRDEVNV
ncbi:MAG: winged helix-turn-helix domain-containing protein [Bdellovibrionota bacterium]